MFGLCIKNVFISYINVEKTWVHGPVYQFKPHDILKKRKMLAY